MNSRRIKSLRKGFTLIELLVVVAIIGILAAIITVSISSARQRGNIAAGQEFSQTLSHGFGAEALGIWNFDDVLGSSVADSSSNGGNATLTGGASVVPGIKDNGMQTGGGYAYVPYNANNKLFGTLSQLTLAAWVYPTSYSGGTYGPTVIGTTQGGGWAMRVNDGRLMSDFRLSDGQNYAYYWGGKKIPLNEWTHIAVTYDGSKIVGYVNGTEVGNIPNRSGTTLLSAPECMFIGSDPSGCVPQCCGFDWPGKIDEVAVYSQAVTTGGIRKMYEDGLPKFFARK